MQFNLNGLPLDVNDGETLIMIETALDWVAENTSAELDPEAELPAKVKLFIVKYCDLMAHAGGVTSESLGGMSQSFSTGSGIGLLLSDLAAQIFGEQFKGRNRFISAKSRWR